MPMNFDGLVWFLVDLKLVVWVYDCCVLLLDVVVDVELPFVCPGIEDYIGRTSTCQGRLWRHKSLHKHHVAILSTSHKI